MKKFLLFILFGLHIFILSKLQFTAWPEMVSFPYLINHGFVTYRDMVHAYPPFLINILAFLYKIFGFNIWTLKIFGWASFIVNDLLIFLIIRKLTQKTNFALAGVFSYVILQSILEGNMVWPDIIMTPFLLGGFLLILNKKYFFAGISFALALLTKQTAVLYIGFCVLYIAISSGKLKDIIKFSSGLLIVILPFLVSLIYQKSLQEFLNWTIIYPSKYWTKFPGYVRLDLSLREGLILLVLLLPTVFLVIKKIKDDYFYLLLGFLICGIIGIYPRFSFFHLQPFIAFTVLVNFYLAKNLRQEFIYVFLFSTLLILIFNFKSLEFGGNRFWENSDLQLVEIIKHDSSFGQPIYLLGPSSSLYAFADRVPPKPWLDNFGWYLEIPEVQDKVIAGFEKDRPSVIFWQTPSEGNWYDIGVYQPKEIADWIMKNYEKKQEVQKGIWEWVKK